jgi:hypothetical protein
LYDLPREGRKITSVSFNTVLWSNFRNEAKRRHEEIQDVFDRLMASYVTGQPDRLVSNSRENTNAVRESVTVVTEEKVTEEKPGWGNLYEQEEEEDEEAEFAEDPFGEQSDEEEE